MCDEARAAGFTIQTHAKRTWQEFMPLLLSCTEREADQFSVELYNYNYLLVSSLWKKILTAAGQNSEVIPED